MVTAPRPGRVVVLNGAPRSGKSSIVEVIQATYEGVWMNLGVDVFAGVVTPPRYRPGIGLRPGGERREIESVVPALYAALFESVAAHSRLGLDVVVDVGLHDGYATPHHVVADAARRLAGLPALFVGVRCPIETIMARRDAAAPGREGVYERTRGGGLVPEAVLRWQREVHVPGIYDVEVDTAVLSPVQCAESIARRLRDGPPPVAFRRLASDAG